MFIYRKYEFHCYINFVPANFLFKNFNWQLKIHCNLENRNTLIKQIRIKCINYFIIIFFNKLHYSNIYYYTIDKTIVSPHIHTFTNFSTPRKACLIVFTYYTESCFVLFKYIIKCLYVFLLVFIYFFKLSFSVPYTDVVVIIETIQLPNVIVSQYNYIFIQNLIYLSKINIT